MLIEERRSKLSILKQYLYDDCNSFFIRGVLHFRILPEEKAVKILLNLTGMYHKFVLWYNYLAENYQTIWQKIHHRNIFNVLAAVDEIIFL